MSAVLTGPLPAQPGPPKAPPASLKAFVAGVVSSQVVNNALHIVQPLLIAELSGSLALAALLASAETGVHMLGTLVSGGSADRLGSRRVLVVSTALRGAALALVPLGMLLGRLSLVWALAAYTLDAFVRGFVDTGVHALPMSLAEGERAELDRANSTYELAFDLAAVVGPLLLGILLLNKKGFAAHAAIPLGFLASAVLYSFVPGGAPSPEAGRAGRKAKALDWEGWRFVLREPGLATPILGLALFNLFPLRKVWSAFFAKAVLKQSAAAGWIGAAFGAGGILGALAYRRFGGRVPTRTWVLAGVVGTTALAVGWMPGALWPMMAAGLAFGMCNAAAELSLLGEIGGRTPVSLAGRVISVARTGTASASVTLKGLMAAAFGVGAGAFAAFGLVGAGLGVMAVAQFGVAVRLGRSGLRPSPAASPAA